MLTTFLIYSWRSKKNIQSGEKLKIGEKYIIQNNFGQFIGKVIDIEEEKEKEELSISEEKKMNEKIEIEETSYILRKANQTDIKKEKEYQTKEKSILKDCRNKIRQYELPMKLVGASHSIDGGGIIVAFTAESRVDFRELVRDLSRTFQKAVRLEQIGSRDEAKYSGSIGPCGRELCCAKFDGPMKSINTDMARVQQITHRGSERISGSCGRLMCCLSYEVDLYEELMKNLPQIEEKVSIQDGIGIVENLKVLQKKILVAYKSKDKNGKVRKEKKWYSIEDVNYKEKEK
jgi:cell fate regulator YaaT (PSP1 superfamily)